MALALPAIKPFNSGAGAEALFISLPHERRLLKRWRWPGPLHAYVRAHTSQDLVGNRRDVSLLNRREMCELCTAE